jgi:exosortase/archaeosortase family protein
VIVDAPCSGVQMAWMAYFAACALSAFTRRRDAHLLQRVPLVSLAVLCGNVLRNSVLVALEARPQGLAPWAHEAIGLLALALVVLLTLRLVAPREAGRT